MMSQVVELRVVFDEAGNARFVEHLECELAVGPVFGRKQLLDYDEGDHLQIAGGYCVAGISTLDDDRIVRLDIRYGTSQLGRCFLQVPEDGGYLSFDWPAQDLLSVWTVLSLNEKKTGGSHDHDIREFLTIVGTKRIEEYLIT